MKFTERDIENQFKNMDADAPVDFDEAYWREVELRLPKNIVRKRSVLSWWWIVLLLFGIGTTALLQISPLSLTEGKRQIAEKTNTAKMNSSENQQKKDDSLSNSFKTKKDIFATKIASLSSAKQGNEIRPDANEKEKSTVMEKFEGETVQYENLTPRKIIIDTNYSKEPQPEDTYQKTEVHSSDEVKKLISDVLTPVISNQTTQSMDSENETEKKDWSQEKAISPLKENQNHSSWKMYVAGAAGMQTNLGNGSRHQFAGLFRFEYGVTKSIGRFSFSPSIQLESTFGNIYQFDNLYVTYDLIRNEHQQSYHYNRMTNAMLNLQFGYSFGKKAKNQLTIIFSPTFNLYNNIVYKETRNNELIAHNQYYNQSLGINKVYFTGGLRYSYWLNEHLSIGVQIDSNFGTFAKRSFKTYQPSVSESQASIRIQYVLK